MNKKRIAQYCCAALVASGIGLNIQNAIADYGIGEDSLSLVAKPGSGSNSSSNSNSNSNSNSYSNSNSDTFPDMSDSDSDGKGEDVKFACVREVCAEVETEETKEQEHSPGVSWYVKYEYSNKKVWGKKVKYTYHKGTCIPGGSGTLTKEQCLDNCPSDEDCP